MKKLAFYIFYYIYHEALTEILIILHASSFVLKYNRSRCGRLHVDHDVSTA